jgi:hypothetical protein
MPLLLPFEAFISGTLGYAYIKHYFKNKLPTEIFRPKGDN